MAVAHCLYGAEIVDFRVEDIRKLDVIQNSMGRWYLGVPWNITTETLRGEIG